MAGPRVDASTPSQPYARGGGEVVGAARRGGLRAPQGRARHRRHRARARDARRDAAPARRARGLRPVLPGAGPPPRAARGQGLADALGERRDRDVQLEPLDAARASRCERAGAPRVELLARSCAASSAGQPRPAAARCATPSAAACGGAEAARAMKARQVAGLEPAMPLAEAARRIVRVRTDGALRVRAGGARPSTRSPRCTTCGSPPSGCATCSSWSASASARTASEARGRARELQERARRDPRLRRDARADRREPRRPEPAGFDALAARFARDRARAVRRFERCGRDRGSRLRERLFASTLDSLPPMTGGRIITRCDERDDALRAPDAGLGADSATRRSTSTASCRGWTSTCACSQLAEDPPLPLLERVEVRRDLHLQPRRVLHGARRRAARPDRGRRRARRQSTAARRRRRSTRSASACSSSARG